MTRPELIEQTLVVADGEKPTVGEIAVGHRFLAELPTVAVRIAAYGRGAARGRSAGWLARVCRFDYLGATAQGVIRFAAPTLGSAAPEVFSGQLDLFRESVDPSLTAFSLLGQGVDDVVRENADSDRVDDTLLRKFEILTRRAFTRGASVISLDGLQDRGPLALDSTAPTHARRLLEETPPPRRARVAGRLTLLKVRGEVLEVTTEDGETARCSFVGGQVESLRNLFNKSVVVAGTAIYRPSGRLLRIDAERVEEARAADAVFSRVPSVPRTLSDRIKDLRSRGGGNWLSKVVGKWPGDESEEELLDALRRTE